MEKIPDEIVAEVVSQQTEMGWPEMVPRYIEFERDGKELWTKYLKTNVSDCNQIAEYHSRKGVAAILAWEKRPSAKWRRRAGRHILMARLMRCRYFTLMGIENSTEADMPFPQTATETT